MNPLHFWFPIFALFGIVIVAPAWVHFAGPAADGLPLITQFLVALFMPIAILLTAASWLQPG